jgi:hypothetical protein
MKKPKASSTQNRAEQEFRAGQEPRLAVLQEGEVRLEGYACL